MHIYKTVSILVVMLGVLTMPAYAEKMLNTQASSAVKIFSEHDNGQSVVLKQGALFDLRLQGNMTTGYGWEITNLSGNAVQKLSELKYTPQATNLVGAGGTFVGHFKAASTGKSTLELAYRRPWEKGVKPVQTYTLTVSVVK